MRNNLSLPSCLTDLRIEPDFSERSLLSARSEDTPSVMYECFLRMLVSYRERHNIAGDQVEQPSSCKFMHTCNATFRHLRLSNLSPEEMSHRYFYIPDGSSIMAYFAVRANIGKVVNIFSITQTLRMRTVVHATPFVSLFGLQKRGLPPSI